MQFYSCGYLATAVIFHTRILLVHWMSPRQTAICNIHYSEWISGKKRYWVQNYSSLYDNRCKVSFLCNLTQSFFFLLVMKNSFSLGQKKKNLKICKSLTSIHLNSLHLHQEPTCSSIALQPFCIPFSIILVGIGDSTSKMSTTHLP